MTLRRAHVNGIQLAYEIRGSGPPLVLVMGYRLNSRAWPSEFITALARRFTLVLFDNRGTGMSDKPTSGYALANIAKDVCGLLDFLNVPRAHVLGYSMGGAVAQELACRYPERVHKLVLCATLCGGPRTVYAGPAVTSVMRSLVGLSAHEAAERIATVTYAPAYLAQNRERVDEQMLREIAEPTPLHAADLQFQAFVDFDSSRALPDLRAPTLVLTGDQDRLIPPGNAKILAKLIPDSRLVILPGLAHRALWEATEECASLIEDFLVEAKEKPQADEGKRQEARANAG
ncbi:MAG: alpha/beta hydrolase [Hyphomicrobiales bacterium]|nr:alpha/beta hydrolase [Hyphomicrobiales bacterium]MBV9591944.1 alpha/beta hydrolase [Hyphomicrobiales bacterium]